MSFTDNLNHFIKEIEQMKIILEGFEEHVITTPKLDGNDAKQLTVVFQTLLNTIEKATSELQLAETRCHEIYDESPVLYRTINFDGIIIDCNKKYAERLGYKKSEILGTSIFDYVDDDNIQKMKYSFESWKKNGKVSNLEIWLKTKFGAKFPVLLSAGTLYDDKGNVIGSNTILQEISDLYKAKKATEEKIRLDARIKDLEKSDKLREELLSIVKHEFKTPLMPIKGYCEILQEQSSKNLTKEQKHALNSIYQNVDKFDQVIDKILDIHSLETNQLAFNEEIILVDDFMRGITDDFSKKITQKDVGFINSNTNKSEIKGDVLQLKHVFDHIINNAIAFTPTETGKIEIGTKTNERMIVFYVKNNGPAIPKEEQQNIFKKFYQIDSSKTRRHQGMGLGLAICKEVINKLGGKIWCESKDEETIFYFSVPIHKEKLTMELK